MDEEELRRIEQGSPASLVEAAVAIGFDALCLYQWTGLGGLAVVLLLAFLVVRWWL